MDKKKTELSTPVIIQAEIPFVGTSLVTFEYSGDLKDKKQVKEAIWEAVHCDKRIELVDFVEQEYVDDSRRDLPITWEVLPGCADGYVTPPKVKTNKQLKRDVARLFGELILGVELEAGPFTSRDIIGTAESFNEFIQGIGDSIMKLDSRRDKLMWLRKKHKLENALMELKRRGEA